MLCHGFQLIFLACQDNIEILLCYDMLHLSLPKREVLLAGEQLQLNLHASRMWLLRLYIFNLLVVCHLQHTNALLIVRALGHKLTPIANHSFDTTCYVLNTSRPCYRWTILRAHTQTTKKKKMHTLKTKANKLKNL